MIVTDKFVFIHLPRTGGTFTYEIIKRFFPTAQEIGYHLPRVALPAQYAHLPVLGGVRNPWDFYASWYHHQYSDTKFSPLFCGLSENRTLGFDQTVRNALNLGVSDTTLDRLIQGLPQQFDFQKRNISNVTQEVMRKIRGSGLGLYTFRFNQMFQPCEEVFFCRVESLRSDLLAFFEKIGAATDPLRKYVHGLDKKNASEHRHYSDYYTQELVDLIRLRERPLIERFAYTFERQSSLRSGAAKGHGQGNQANNAVNLSEKPI
jgi:hypothetical protein